MDKHYYVNKQLPLQKSGSRTVVPLFRGFLQDDKTYYLRYEIEGVCGGYEYSAIGSDLLNAYATHKQITFLKGVKENLDLAMREEANSLLELIACSEIFPERYKELKKSTPEWVIESIESNNQKSVSWKNMIILSRLCMSVISEDQIKDCDMVKLIDKPFLEEDKNFYKDSWMNESITEQMGFKNFDEFCNHMKLGVLVTVLMNKENSINQVLPNAA